MFNLLSGRPRLPIARRFFLTPNKDIIHERFQDFNAYFCQFYEWFPFSPKFPPNYLIFIGKFPNFPCLWCKNICTLTGVFSYFSQFMVQKTCRCAASAGFHVYLSDGSCPLGNQNAGDHPDQLEGEHIGRFYDKSLDAGVAYVAGEFFHPDGSGKNTMRLNFSFMSPERIKEGVRLLDDLLRNEIL